MGERYRDVIIRSTSDRRPGRPPQRSDRGKCAAGKGGVYVRPKRLTPALPQQLGGGAFGGSIEAAVRHGENSGRMLPHKDVVREMILLGQWRGEAGGFPAPARRTQIAEAAIVQAAESGPILVAANSEETFQAFMRLPYV